MEDLIKNFIDEVKTIPQENQLKFFIDLNNLVQKAKGDDYENFSF